nr:transposase [Alphaproteobacteria bacterium]
GKNVQAKSGLNKSILDQGWYEFRRQLEYKLRWRGGELRTVPAQFTSQRCSCCGEEDKASRKTQSRYKCTSCGYEANADHNAAKNILAAGLAVTACGASKNPPVAVSVKNSADRNLLPLGRGGGQSLIILLCFHRLKKLISYRKIPSHFLRFLLPSPYWY